MAGLFVAVEGPEGAGKTTLVARLAARLRSGGHDVLVAREPGGTETAEAARRLVLDPAMAWESAAELFLILTARAELVAKALDPALRAGAVVLCDRYDLSTRAYQIAGRGLPEGEVLAANRLATGGLEPALTLVLDLEPAEGRKRQAAQGKAPDRMEQADAAMHERVAAAFREASGPGVVHLDASRSIDEVTAAAWAAVEALLRGAG
jgi:dTMP kinase